MVHLVYYKSILGGPAPGHIRATATAGQKVFVVRLQMMIYSITKYFVSEGVSQYYACCGISRDVVI